MAESRTEIYKRARSFVKSHSFSVVPAACNVEERGRVAYAGVDCCLLVDSLALTILCEGVGGEDGDRDRERSSRDLQTEIVESWFFLVSNSMLVIDLHRGIVIHFTCPHRPSYFYIDHVTRNPRHTITLTILSS